ncbi:MAG: GNAT family N-acetyltransferase [Sedimentisphaerales bacterium]|nr:GNAT family N-acetyltransferase [Sedimentisphaerales bacterium]
MDAQLVDNFANGTLYDSWNALLSQAADANAQLTHEWLSSCWEIFSDRKKLSLITVNDGSKIVGIAPLTIATVIDKAGMTLKKLTFVGDGLTDYHDLLTADEKREEILRILIEFIVEGKKDWDVIHFRNVRGDSPNLPILRNILTETSFRFMERINIRSPYISIDRDWTDYYSTLGKNIRSDVRRRSNVLAKLGKAEFVRLHKVNDVTDTLHMIKSIHVKYRKAKGDVSWYTNEKRFRFASLIVKRFGDRKWLDIVFLKLNDQIIAYYLGFVYGNIVYFWNTGFDPDFSKVGPGKLLLHFWIKDSFAKGYSQFDFMVGEESYKLQWTSPTRPNYEFFVFKNTTRSHIFKCYYTYKPALMKNPYLRKIGAGIKSRIKD